MMQPMPSLLATLLITAAMVLPSWAETALPPPPPGGVSGTAPPSPPPGGVSETAYVLSGAKDVATGTLALDGVLTSDQMDVSALYVHGGAEVTLTGATVTTTGESSSKDNSSFHGLNAAVLVGEGSRLTQSGGTVTTSGSGANGVFAAGTGAVIVMDGVKITATGDAAHGIMATKGGQITAKGLEITTAGQNSAAAATDRGGGVIALTGGRLVTTGYRSPGLYSTGTITADQVTVDSQGAEAAVVEGSNTITLTDSDLTATKNAGVMMYQSFSGDAEGVDSSFTMTGGSLTVADIPAFYVNNANAEIALDGVRIVTGSGVLAKAAKDSWGTEGANGGHMTLSLTHEAVTGDIIADEISSLAVTLGEGTLLTGSMTNASVVLAGGGWVVTADSALETLTADATSLAQINGGGHVVTYDATLTGNAWLNGASYDLTGGGSLQPL